MAHHDRVPPGVPFKDNLNASESTACKSAFEGLPGAGRRHGHLLGRYHRVLSPGQNNAENTEIQPGDLTLFSRDELFPGDISWFVSSSHTFHRQAHAILACEIIQLFTLLLNFVILSTSASILTPVSVKWNINTNPKVCYMISENDVCHVGTPGTTQQHIWPLFCMSWVPPLTFTYQIFVRGLLCKIVLEIHPVVFGSFSKVLICQATALLFTVSDCVHL